MTVNIYHTEQSRSWHYNARYYITLNNQQPWPYNDKIYNTEQSRPWPYNDKYI
jgi:hypothetical protein